MTDSGAPVALPGPSSTMAHAALVDDIDVFPVDTLTGLVKHLQ